MAVFVCISALNIVFSSAVTVLAV